MCVHEPGCLLLFICVLLFQTFLDKAEVTDRVVAVLKNFEKVEASKVGVDDDDAVVEVVVVVTVQASSLTYCRCVCVRCPRRRPSRRTWGWIRWTRWRCAWRWRKRCVARAPPCFHDAH